MCVMKTKNKKVIDVGYVKDGRKLSSFGIYRRTLTKKMLKYVFISNSKSFNLEGWQLAPMIILYSYYGRCFHQVTISTISRSMVIFI